MRTTVRAPLLADWALAHGRSHLTTAEAADLLGVPADQVRHRLAAPAARHEWASPARGLWVPVPPEYRTWGAPPGIELVDLLAAHVQVDYYVGWLSAAELHGASHHAPQVFQVAVTRALRNRTIGRTAFSFHTRPVLVDLPVTQHPTIHGSARVSTPEVTALDLAHDIHLSGGVDNAATVLLELEDSVGLDRTELERLAPLFPATSLRRLGYVLDRCGKASGLEGLEALVAKGPPSDSRLSPTAGLTGRLDPRWRLRLNHDLEVEW